MKVSDLVKFRNELIDIIDKLSIDESVNKICGQIHSVGAANDKVKLIVADKITAVIDEFQSLLVNSKNIIANLPLIVSDIETIIDDTATREFNESNELKYSCYFKHTDVPYEITTLVDDLIKSRLTHHANWHYPGLQLGCRTSGKLASKVDGELSTLSQFTNLLVTSDPLYLCDFNQEYINNATAQFNEVYQKRLRTYLINSSEDLMILPHAQFSFILAWNLFNYASINTLEQYLIEIFKLLRAGGTAMFSYNNGDIFESAVLAEMGAMSYIPKRHLITLCESLGFIVKHSYDELNDNNNYFDAHVTYISWVEISKPGVLTTIKAHQAMGAVIEK